MVIQFNTTHVIISGIWCLVLWHEKQSWGENADPLFWPHWIHAKQTSAWNYFNGNTWQFCDENTVFLSVATIKEFQEGVKHGWKRTFKTGIKEIECECECENLRRLCVCEEGVCVMQLRWTYWQRVNGLVLYREVICYWVPIPVAERSKASVCSRSPAGIVGSNPAVGMDVCLLWVLCVCQVEVCANGSSLVQRSPTDTLVSLCVISKPQELGG